MAGESEHRAALRSDSEAAARERVVAEARSWIGTKWQHAQCLKGAGVDCAMLVIRCFCDTGIVPAFDPRPYSREWFLHRDEPLFLGHILAHGREIEQAEVQPADIVLWKIGRQFAHAGIVTQWPYVVHAFAEEGIVTETNVDLPGVMTDAAKHPRRFFSAFR